MYRGDGVYASHPDASTADAFLGDDGRVRVRAPPGIPGMVRVGSRHAGDARESGVFRRIRRCHVALL